MTDIVPIPGAGMGGGDPTMAKLLSVADDSRRSSAVHERELKASQQREDVARREQTAAVAPKQAELAAKLHQGAPTPPAAVPQPETPSAPKMDTQQFQQTLGLITFLASIGGAFTRHPLTAALNNFAAGVDGLHKGQQEVYAQQVKEFEENVKKASAQNDQLWKRYEAAAKKFGTDTKGLTEEIKLIAAESQSRIDLELAKQGRIVELMKLHENANANYAKVLGEVTKFGEEHRAHAETARHNAATEKLAAGKAEAAAGAAGPSSHAADQAAAWDYLIRGHSPPARGGAYQRAMNEVSIIAKENGMTTEQLITASADVKTKLAAKRQFEVRTQNLARAENQLMLEIPVMEDAMKRLDLSSLPIAARGKIEVLRQMGNPDVTRLDQAAEAVFNEFEGIITGNPGTLNVQDVTQAKHQYDQAKTPQQMKAAVDGMRRIIANAKKANDMTRDEIMEGISTSVNPRGRRSSDAAAPAPGVIPADWTVKEH